GAVAERVLERRPRAGAQALEGREADRVHGAVLADRRALRGAELADATQEDARRAVHHEDADGLAARLDAAEVRTAVRDRAPGLAVHAAGEEAVHVRLVVEHEVLPELAARVAEHGAARSGGEEAEARRLDRTRGQHEGAGRHALPSARAADILDPAHVPAVVHEPA